MTLYPLRPNVCMLVRNSAGQLFLGERLGEAGVWQFPQGGIDEGLTAEASVLKELHEELGIPAHLLRIERQLAATHSYEFAAPRDYSGRIFRGQAQSFWLVEFLGADTDIRLDLHEPEFMNWRWCTPAEVAVLADPQRLPGYRAPLAEVAALLTPR